MTQHDKTRHDMTWHDTTRHDTTHDTTRHNTTQHDTTQHNTTHQTEMERNRVEPSRSYLMRGFVILSFPECILCFRPPVSGIFLPFLTTSHPFQGSFYTGNWMHSYCSDRYDLTPAWYIKMNSFGDKCWKPLNKSQIWSNSLKCDGKSISPAGHVGEFTGPVWKPTD